MLGVVYCWPCSRRYHCCAGGALPLAHSRSAAVTIQIQGVANARLLMIGKPLQMCTCPGCCRGTFECPPNRLAARVGPTFAAEILVSLHSQSPHTTAQGVLVTSLAGLGVAVAPLRESMLRDHLFISPRYPAAASIPPALYRLSKGCIVWAKVKCGKVTGTKSTCWWPSQVQISPAAWLAEPTYVVSVFPRLNVAVTVKPTHLRPFSREPNSPTIFTKTGVSAQNLLLCLLCLS
jgi:hypothetical protein